MPNSPSPQRVFEYAMKLYEYMDTRATDGTHDGLPIRVYKGPAVETYVKAGAPRANYSLIKHGMEQTGCVTVLHTGSKYRPQEWALHHPPSLEQWTTWQQESIKRPTIDYATLRQKVDEIHRMIGGIPSQETIARLARVVAEQEKQIQELTRRMDLLQ